MKTVNNKIFKILMVFCMVFSLVTPSFAFAEVDSSITKQPIVEQPIVIGGYDGPLSECLDSDDPELMLVSNVRVNSFATYDSFNGVQVYIELYVPWYSFPKPQFTSMTGIVHVNLNKEITDKPFYKFANGTPTIETTVRTGVTVPSQNIGIGSNIGIISIEGAATSNNALGGGGAFSISYPITIL